MNRYVTELRSRMDGNTVHGHASVFGQMAQLPGHYEAIARSAFDSVLDSTDTDVRALFNHDPNMILGRQSAGNLRLKVDDEGLAFELDLPDTSVARDVRALIGSGLVTGASFGFIPGDDTWSSTSDGSQLRTHTQVRELIDVSIVSFPAYSSAGVSLRHYDFRVSGKSQLIRARHRVRTASWER